MKTTLFSACAVLAILATAPVLAQAPTLDDLSAKIGSAQDGRRWAEAITLGQQALAIEEREKGPESADVGGTLSLIGGFMNQLDRNAEAEPLQRRALAIFLATQGEASPLTVTATNNLAATLESLGKLKDAETLYTQSLDRAIRVRGKSHRDVALALSNLGYNLARQGRFRDAQTQYDKALAMGRLTMDSEDEALALIQNNVANNLTSRGRMLAAEPLYNQVLKLRLKLRGPDHRDVATSYNGLAFNLSAQGRHDDAAPLYAKAMAIRAKINPEDRRAATSYNNVAHNLLRRGKAAEAAPLYAHALAIWEKLYGEKNALTAIGISNVGADLEEQGKLVPAQAQFERALRVRIALLGDAHPDVGQSYFKLAHNLKLQGKAAPSEINFKRAVDIRRAALGAFHPDLALTLTDYADLLNGLGPSRSADALRLAREAAAIARKRRAQQQSGEAAGEAGAEQQARVRAASSEARADPLAGAFGVLLRAAWQRAASTPAEAEALKAEGYEAAQDVETSFAALTMAQTAARTAAGTGPLGKLVREQQDLSAKARELDHNLLAALGSGDAANTQRIRNEIAASGTALANADAFLRKQFPDYAEMVQPRALTLADTRARLGADEGLLLIVPVGPDIFSFGVSGDRLAWNRFAGGGKTVQPRAARLTCQVDPVNCNPATRDADLAAGAPANSPSLADGLPAYDRGAAYSLYADLVKPVETAVTGKAHLFVTADGALGGLPLNILITAAPKPGEDGADPKILNGTQWLVDRYGLVSLPAVSVLRALKRKVAAKSGTAFIGYGAPILDGPGTGKRAVNMGSRFVLKIDEEGINLADPDLLRTLNPLPGTERELSAMAAALKAPKRDVLLGAAATETAVRRDPNLGKARIIAFATHGVLPREVNGIEEPGLVLTPPAAPSPSDDGLLTASEVSKLTLNADWVLLSACNTASADGTPGADSLSSLSRAFLYAGAQALLASHWRVSDDATAALTVETLAGRSSGSLNRADALKAAMLAVRTGKRTDGSAVTGWNDGWAHPSAWAPFTVISSGDE